MRVAVAIACLFLAGCPDQFPQAVSVQAFAAAPPDRSFVLVYEPWAPDMQVVGRGNVAVLGRVEGVKLSCANVACDAGADGNHVVVKQRPPNDRLELVVEKEGFEPVRVVVPIEGLWFRNVAVVLHPK